MDTDNPVVDKKDEKQKSFLHRAWNSIPELIRFILLALIIVIPVRMYVAQPFIVNGESMDPTFKDRDYLIVDELTYRFEAPKRGDVVILKYEYGYEKVKPYFIKRIIGLPGETVTIDGNAVIIKNKAHPEGFTLNEPYIVEKNFPDQKLSLTLGDKEFFVMGDNRPHSKDARIWSKDGTAEALQEKDILGRPLLRLFPFSEATLFPGEFHDYKN
ncbi:MAG: signal peptidase I [Candidatus Pacebacteria bacterium]|nr:signal peptidase I [Candidatus Paceibacterota bacterium]